MDAVKGLRPLEDPATSLPFIRTILSSLRQEVEGQATLLGFVGTPWTLAAYAVEGKADKECRQTKVCAVEPRMFFNSCIVTHQQLGNTICAFV